MRRKKTFKRGRVISIVVAGGIGYLIGGWQTVAVRSTDLSAVESVAQRFPQDWNDASPATAASALSPATSASTVSAMSNVQFALLSPEPMVPQVASQTSPQTVPQAMVQTAALEQLDASAAPVADEPPPTATTPPASASKAAAVAAHRRANRPGFLLNDAQIASIKERLNLTPDQEPMWPAVEVALRNISYTRAQEEHRHGGGAGPIPTASVDPNSAEVQGLKSAAAPLIMSFNAEQKEEVRNLAHVMGLDQFATQF